MTVWIALAVAYALVLLALLGASGAVALFGADRRRAARAGVLIKTMLAASAATGSLFATLTHLHNLL